MKNINIKLLKVSIYIQPIKNEMFEELCGLRNYDILDRSKYLAMNKDTGERIQFIITWNDKLDMSYFYKAYNQLPTITSPNNEHITHLIFIYTIATIQIKKLKMYKDIINIEFFNENELRRLLIGNRFIPKHTRLTKEEQDIVVNKFGKDNLPCILISDPIVKLYDFQLDSIIQIERNDTIYYRRVIEDF